MRKLSTQTEALPLEAPSLLTSDEVNFVYNLEVLGLPVKKAAALAGVRADLSTRGHIVEARERLRRDMRGATATTKEDVIQGFLDAVEHAKILADPRAEIAGWKEIGLLQGHYAPAQVDVNMNAAVEVLQTALRALPTDELVKRLGVDDIVDAEFYVPRAP